MKLKKLLLLATMTIGLFGFSITAHAEELKVCGREFETEEADKTIDLGGGVSAFVYVDEIGTDTVLIDGKSGKMNDFNEMSTSSTSPFYEMDEFNVYVSDDVSYLGDRLFDRINVRSVKGGKGLTEIGEKCFYLSKVSNVSFLDAENLKTIPKDCFYGCNDLNVLELPKGLEKIEAGAFQGCIHINDVSAPISCDLSGLPNSVSIFRFTRGIDGKGYDYSDYEIVRKAAWNTNKDASIILENGIIYIGNYMFADNKKTEIELPNSLEEIGNAAFINADVESITIPANVFRIGNTAFKGTNLTKDTVLFEGDIENVDLMKDAFEFSFDEEPEEVVEAEEKDDDEKDEDKAEASTSSKEKSEEPKKKKGFDFKTIIIVILVGIIVLPIVKKKLPVIEKEKDNDDSINNVSYYSDEEESDFRECPHCHVYIKKDKKFCPKCGNKIE